MKKIILFTFSCFFLLIASAQIPATNLQLWLKADAGVIKDGSNSVSEWTDQSINGRRVLQASAANQPVWFDNILNNKPVIRFDGSNDLFQAFESNGSTPLLTPATLEFTFFIAAKAVNPVSAIRYQGNGNCIAYPYTFTGASNGFISCQEGQTSGIPHGLSSSQFNVGTAIYKVNTPNGMRTYVDGLLVGQRNTGNHSTLGTDPLGIGGCLSGCAVSEFFGGDIAEIIIYDRAVSNAERIQIETYLSGKYNIIPPSPVASGLVAYYPLNGNVNDASGNSLNGTIIGTATPVADRFSIANSANSFNGSTRVEVADNALLRTTNVTMSAWVYFTNTPGTQIIAAKNLANTTFESYMLFFFNGNIAGAWGNAGTVDLLTGPVPSTNQWHLITYSFDDANDLASLYLDGALVNTKASALSIGYDNSTFSIATELESNNYGFFYNGIIDEVKIYNTALSAGQVLAEYNQANPGTTFYQDLDNDSHGNPAVSQIALTAPVGFVADSLDCNDANAAIPFTHFLYRTVASGNWNTLAIWEKNDGCNWTAANSIPSSADSSITIRTGHSVTISNALTADELTVDAGGTLEQLSNLTLANGIGDDLTVNGTWNWGSGHLIGPGIAVIANNAVLNINGGSTRFMAAANIINNGTLDWQNGRLEFTGSISSLTNNATMTISGNNSTGFNGSRLALTNNGTITKTSTGTTDLTGFTVLLNNGTFNCNAGTTTFADANAGGTFTNTGNLSFNGGTFNVNNGGTFNHNSGSVISGTGNFNNGGLMNVNVPLIFPASLLFASTGAIDGLGDLTINNDFTMQGNIYGGSGLNIKAIATWNSGHLGRNLVIDAGRVFNIAGGSARFLVAASITNNGTLDWQNGRLEFTGGNSSLLNNSIMTITGNNSTGFSGSRLALTNNGTITKTSTGATDLVGFTVFLNNGTFNCNAGTTTFADANAGGALTNTGNFIFNGGTFTVNNGGTFNHNSGSVISGTGNFNNGGLMNVNVPLVFPASLLFASTGAIDGPGDLTINNDFTMQGNIYGGSGLNIKAIGTWNSGHLGRNLVIDAGRVFNIAGGSARFLVAAGIINNGTLDWQNGRLEFTGGNSSLINNSIMTITGNNSTGFGGSRLALTNNGTITKTSTGATDLVGFTVFLNNGTLNCNAGTTTFADGNAGGSFTNTGNLILNNNAIFTLNPGGVFNNNTSASLKGVGTFNFNSTYTNIGIVSPGSSLGLLTINGQQPLSASSTLNIEMQDGSGAGTGHDQLIRATSMTLAGTLNVTETGAVPNGTYTIINAGGFIGSFATINLPAGYTLDINATTVTVTRLISIIADYRSVTSGNWSDASTWEVFNGTGFVAASVAPSNTDGVITIRSGHTVTVTDMVSTDQTIIELGATLIQSADLGIANGDGEDLTVNGTWIWNSGSLLGPVAANPGSTIVVSTGGIFNLSTSSLKKFRSAPLITNNGNMNWQDGDLEFGVFNSSLINNGLFTISGNNTSYANIDRLSIINNGSITKTSSGTTNMSGILLLSNVGSLNCTAGNFLFGQNDAAGTFANTGNIVLSNGGTFTVATTYDHNAGAVISGTGNFTNHGTVNFNINQNFPSSIVFTNTATIAGSGDLIINNPFTIEGVIEGGGLLSIKEAAIWNDGNITRNFIIDAGRTLTLVTVGGKRFGNGASLTNNGIIDWQNGNIAIGINGPGNASLVNNGVFTISGNLSITSVSNSGLQITNNGNFNKTSTGTTTLEAISLFLNAGTFTSQGNIIFGQSLVTLSFTNTGTGVIDLINSNFTNVSNAPFNNDAGGILKGSGVYSFPFTFINNGIIAPGSSPGILTVNGQEPLSANSTLQIEILDGSGAGSGHDQLVRNGNLTLAGTLTVTEIGNAPNGSYTIISLTAGTISGSFATINLPAGYTIQVNTTTVVLIKDVEAATAGAYRSFQTGNWSDASTWERFNGTAFVPATVAPAAIDGIINIRSGHNVTISSAVVADEIVVDANGTITQSATLTLENGNGNDLSVNGNWIFNSGSFKGPGNAVIETTGTLYIGTGDNKFLEGAIITNNGSVTWSDGTIGCGTLPSIITNNNEFIITGNNQIQNVGSTCSLINNGSITKTSSGTTTFAGSGISLSNNGILNLNGGIISLSFSGPHNNAGIYSFNSGTLNIQTSTLNWNIGASINGNGTVNNTGNIILNAALTFPTGFIFTHTGESNSISGIGDLTINNDFNTSGRIAGSGLMVVTGNTTWSAGSWGRAYNIPSERTLTISGGSNKFMEGASITNNGSIIWQDGFIGFGTLPGIITNNNEFIITGNNSMANVGSTCSLFNNGSITKTSSGSTDFGGISLFSNSGTGSIRGVGTYLIPGLLQNNGIIAPGNSPGILTFNGGQPLSANSVLQIEIQDGTGAGTGHDQLVRNGDLTLAGTLNVTQTGLVPNGTYTIINLSSGIITGSFATINLPAGYTLEVNATTVTVTTSIISFADYRSIASGNWSNASTWEIFNGTAFVPASVAPSNTDGIITIRSGHTVTVTDMVSTDQTIIESGGTLIQSADLGIANGDGEDLTVYGTWTWNSGSLLGPVASNATTTILISNTGIFNLSTSGLKKFRSAPLITNNGNMNWQDGDLEFGVFNSNLINNGLFTISGNNTSYANIDRLSIINNGSITKTSSGTTNMSGILLLSNVGSLNCTAGNFLFGQNDATGTFANTGNIVLSNGGTFTVATTYDHNAGAVISGTGNFTNHGTVNFNINQNFPSSIVFTNTATIAGSGDLVINNPFTIEGAITGGGLLSIKEAAIWNEGTITRNFIVDAGRTLTLATEGGKRLGSGASLTNNGIINWQNGNIAIGINPSPNATLVNNGLFTISGNSVISSPNGTGLQITNNGTINKTSTGTTTIGSAGFSIINAATIKGIGTLLLNPVTFTNNGIIAPGSSPGILTVNGQEPLSANSTLQIEILDGSGAGSGHDQLVRNGNLTLAGTLTVTEIGNAPNGSYTIINLTAGTITGSFATINLPAGYTLQINSTNVVLVRNITCSTAPAIITISPPTATFCEGHDITLTASSGSEFLWSNGATVPSITVTTSGDYSVTITDNNHCAATSSVTTVTMIPTPVVNTVSNQTINSGNVTSMTGFTGNATLYGWSNNNTSIGLPANGTGVIPPFTAVNTGSVDVVATITVTPISTVNGFSCIGEPISFTITVQPAILVSNIPNQIVCRLTLTTAVTFENLPGVIYEWVNNDPSIGLPANGTGDIPSFSAQNNGSIAIIANITVTPIVAGVANSAVSFSIKVNPMPVMNPVSGFRYCNGTNTDPVIFGGTATEFEWTNSEPSIGLAASGTGNIPSFIASAIFSSSLSGNIFVRNYSNDGIRCQGTSESFTFIVNPTPLMNNVASRTLCSGNVNSTITFSGVNATQYQWTNDNINIGLLPDGSGNIASFVATNNSNTNITGNIVVTPQFIGNGFFCFGPSKNFQITVLPIPDFDPIPSQRVCTGANINSVSLSVNVPNSTFTWTNDNPTIGLPASGTGNIPSFIAVNNGVTPASANITVNLSANGCNGNPRTFNIIVDPVPVVGPIPNQVYCNNSLTGNIDFTSNINGIGGFTWTNDNPAIGLPASGEFFIQSFSATNPGTTAITATITVIQTAGSCTGLPVTFTITVNPSPTVNSIRDTTFCNGSTTGIINFTGNQPDNLYNWTNNDPSIGLAASGSGDIPSFIAINSTVNSIKTALITVRPVSGDGLACVGTARLFAISINPTPSVDNIQSQQVCNGGIIDPITFTGSFFGIMWTNSETSIGLAASSNGLLPLFTALNTGIAPVVATITVTPLYNNNISCAGTPVTFTITVKPTPDINPVASQSICSGGNTTAIIFNGHVANTTYSWINNNPAIGLVNEGNGNIPSFTGYQSNLATGQNIGHIDVTPTANGCIGTATGFTIGINPEPSVENIFSQTVCNGAATSNVDFISAGVSTIYTWTNSNPSIGLAASGTGNIPSFVAVNTGTTAISGIISVTPFTNSNGLLCEGLTKTFNYIVAPTAIVNTVSDQVFCAGGATAFISLSANIPGSAFSLTNSNTAIGLPASFGGPDIVFAPTNNSSVPILATITARATLNGCQGEARSFTITVNPRPVVNNIQNRIFCSGLSSFVIPFNGTATSYTWTNNNTAIGLAASGIGNILPFTAINAGSLPVTATITVVPSYSNAGIACTGISKTFTITIDPAKRITAFAGANGSISPAGTTLLACDGSGSQVYTITADTCYRIANILVDGVSQGTAATFTFNSVSSNHTISATFALKPPLVAPVVTGAVNVCPYVGSATTVTYTAASAGAVGYAWTLPANVSTLSSSNNSITVKFLTGFTTQANKQIRVIALSSCGNSAQTIYYLAAQSPGTAVSISGNTNVCPIIGTGATYTYSISAVPGASSYVWAAPAGTTVSHPNGLGANDSIINISFNNGFNSNYLTVYAVNSCGTGGIRSLVLKRTALSQPGLITGPTSACAYIAPTGVLATYSVIQNPSASSYAWALPAGAINITGQGTSSISFRYPPGFTTGEISVTQSNPCGTSEARTLSINTLYPATPGVIDVIQLQSCPNRIYSYTLSAMPSNTQSLQWTVPLGSTILSGQGTTSITVGYSDGSVNGTVDVTGVSSCRNSTTRITKVKLPSCPASFAKGNAEMPLTEIKKANADTFSIELFPNPSSTVFNLKINSIEKEPVEIKVMDMQGRSLKHIKPGELTSLQFGADLHAGVYLVEIKQGTNIRTIRIVKY